MTDLIKTDWPDAITMISEAQDLVHCNWNRLGEPFFGDDDCFPDTLDWFAYDYYCTAFSARDCPDPYGVNSGWEVQQDGMVHRVYPKMARATQRAIPTTLGFFYNNSNTTAADIEKMDNYCVFSAQRTLAWALADDRIVSVMPFFWRSQPSWIGLRDLPRCSATWEAIGRLVVAGGGAASALRGGGTPGIKKKCPKTSEPIQRHWCRTTPT
uniref:Uncharacterized protein n=1 Tax=Haptolina ericina TaxID=156174 RepID=A0A7S3AJ16_9EUKA